MLPKDCAHPRLTFQSGAFFIWCDDCKTRWIGMDLDKMERDGSGPVVYNYSLGFCPISGEARVKVEE